MIHTRNDEQLVAFAEELAFCLRDATALQIETLAEIRKRRIHLRLGYANMVEFARRRLGMSVDQAKKRVQIARKAADFPRILDCLRNGEGSVSHFALACPRITEANFDMVVAAMDGRSVREFARELARIGDDGTVRDPEEVVMTKVVLTLTEAEMRLLDRVEALLLAKRKLKGGRREDLVMALSQFAIERLDPRERAKRARTPKGATSHLNDTPQRRVRIPAAVQHQVYSSNTISNRCTYRGPDGTRCGNIAVQLDHYPVMVCEAGGNSPANLAPVCQAHNLMRAEDRLGAKFMARRRSGQKQSLFT